MYQATHVQNYGLKHNSQIIKDYFKTPLTLTVAIFAIATSIFGLLSFIFDINLSQVVMHKNNIASPDDTSGVAYISSTVLEHAITFVFSGVNATIFLIIFILCNKENYPAMRLKSYFTILSATPFLQIVIMFFYCRSLSFDFAHLINDIYMMIFLGLIVFMLFVLAAAIFIGATVYYIMQHSCYHSITKSFDAQILNSNGIKAFSVINMIIGVIVLFPSMSSFDFSDCTTTAQVFATLSNILATVCLSVQSILLSRLLADYRNHINIINNRYISIYQPDNPIIFK